MRLEKFNILMLLCKIVKNFSKKFAYDNSRKNFGSKKEEKQASAILVHLDPTTTTIPSRSTWESIGPMWQPPPRQGNGILAFMWMRWEKPGSNCNGPSSTASQKWNATPTRSSTRKHIFRTGPRWIHGIRRACFVSGENICAEMRNRQKSNFLFLKRGFDDERKSH